MVNIFTRQAKRVDKFFANNIRMFSLDIYAEETSIDATAAEDLNQQAKQLRGCTLRWKTNFIFNVNVLAAFATTVNLQEQGAPEFRKMEFCAKIPATDVLETLPISCFIFLKYLDLLFFLIMLIIITLFVIYYSVVCEFMQFS